MEYTVKKLAKIAGVSARTLRYYDQIGLLTPCHVSSSGYRIYGQAEVDQLQRILFYRELGIKLEEIKRIVNDRDYNVLSALEEYCEKLRDRQERLTVLLNTVEKTIEAQKGMIIMSDQEKFAGLKKELIKENERKYGKEIREKYGENIVQESNKIFMNLSSEQYKRMQELAEIINTKLEKAVRKGADPAGETGREIIALHKEWLDFTWREYSPEAHLGLTQMYVDDERFTIYYDKNVLGCAAFLRKAAQAWLEV
jgi:DNA-binding transcriptional MerR regulator